MKTITIFTGLILAFFSFSVRAQMQTLVVAGSTNVTNSAVITVSSNSYAVIKSNNFDYGGYLLVNVQGVNLTFDPTTDNINN